MQSAIWLWSLGHLQDSWTNAGSGIRHEDVRWNSKLSHLHRLAKSDYRCVQSVCHTTRCSLCCLRTRDHYPKRSLWFPVEQIALFKYQETCCFPIDISTSMLRHSRVTSSSRTKIRNPPLRFSYGLLQSPWTRGIGTKDICPVWHVAFFIGTAFQLSFQGKTSLLIQGGV